MKKYIVVVLLFFSQFTLFGGTPCEIYFDSKTPTANSVEINVKVKDFVDVYGYQMFIQWDSTVLRFNSLTYINEAFGNELSYNDGLSADILALGWSSVLQTQTLDDNAVLFTVKYDFEGDPCDETSLALIDQDPYRLSLVTFALGDEDLEEPIRFTPSTVKIPGEDCGTGGGGDNCDDFNGFKLYLEKVVAASGDEVCVKVKVDSFKNIGALQFSVGWDTDVIAWVKEKNNWAASQGASALKSIRGDSLYYYLMNSDNPLTLNDGGTLVELCFKVDDNAVNGDFSILEVVDSLEFEITNSEGVSLGFCTTDGKVTVGDINSTVTLIASNKTSDRNENTCVDITSKNFNEIESFQFLTEWDSTVMKYTHIGSVNKVGILDANINKVNGGKLKLSWNIPVGSITAAEDEILFQLCYDVVGDCNSSTPFKIVGGSFPIEITSNDIALPHTEVDGSVTVECAIIYDVRVEDVICNGDATGKIFVSTECSTCTYTYKWSDDPTITTPSRNGVKAGTYTVTITDTGSGKSVSETVVVNEPDPISITDSSVLPESCEAKGSISLTTVGGNAPYVFAWSNGATTEDLANLSTGDYVVTITDDKGCGSYEQSFTVGSSIEEIVALKGEFGDVTCKDANDGYASIRVTGGCEPYTYLWSDGDTNKDRTGMGEGTFTVKVTDSKGSESVELTFVFTNPAEALAVSGEVTEGLTGKIESNVTGGVLPYAYSWTGPGGFTSLDEIIDGLEAGTYNLTVTDSRGCSKEESFEVLGVVSVTINNVIIGDYNGFGVKCNGDCNGTLDATITANIPYEAFLDGEKISLPYDKLCGGEHVLKIVDRLDSTAQMTITVVEPDELTVEEDEVNCSNDGKDDGSVSVKVSGGTGEYFFDWGSASGDDSSELTDLPKGKYSVIVKDENDCEVVSEDLVVGNCDKSQCYKGSAIITPNGDDFNEFFLVKCADDFVSSTLNVYDRLGNVVYTQSNYDGTWNGLDKDGNELIENSYMWVFIGQKDNGETSVHKGTVSILR